MWFPSKKRRRKKVVHNTNPSQPQQLAHTLTAPFLSVAEGECRIRKPKMTSRGIPGARQKWPNTCPILRGYEVSWCFEPSEVI